MLYLLSLFGLLLLNVHASDDHDHDHDHDGENADCVCATGVSRSEIDCDDPDHALEGIQHYLQENNCKQYCEDGYLHADEADDEEAAFLCLQVWFLMGQYHDYCISGAVNETLFHEYLEVCPDCNEEFFEYEGTDL